LIEVQNLH